MRLRHRLRREAGTFVAKVLFVLTHIAQFVTGGCTALPADATQATLASAGRQQTAVLRIPNHSSAGSSARSPPGTDSDPEAERWLTEPGSGGHPSNCKATGFHAQYVTAGMRDLTVDATQATLTSAGRQLPALFTAPCRRI